MTTVKDFDVKLTSWEVSPWDGLALHKKMMNGMGVQEARAVVWGALGKAHRLTTAATTKVN